MELLTVPVTPEFEVSLKNKTKKPNTQNNISHFDSYPVYCPGGLAVITT
jgi:hypothetical protein